MLQYFVLATLLACLSPVSADNVLTITSDETWTCIGASYIGNAALTWTNSVKASVYSSKWIWKTFQVENPTTEESYTFQKEFNVPGKTTSAQLILSADDSYAILLNGNFIGASVDRTNGGQATVQYDLLSRIYQGRNVVQVDVINWALAGATYMTNPAGLIFNLTLTYI